MPIQKAVQLGISVAFDGTSTSFSFDLAFASAPSGGGLVVITIFF